MVSFLWLWKPLVRNSRPWTQGKLIGKGGFNWASPVSILTTNGCELVSMTKKDKRNILFVQPHGQRQQENTGHLFSENMGRASWSGCQDKAVRKKVFIDLPCQSLILQLHLHPHWRTTPHLTPRKTWEGLEGTEFKISCIRELQAQLEVRVKAVHTSFGNSEQHF